MEILTKGVYMRLLQDVKLGDLFIETERKLGNKRWLTRANGLQLLNAGKRPGGSVNFFNSNHVTQTLLSRCQRNLR